MPVRVFVENIMKSSVYHIRFVIVLLCVFLVPQLVTAVVYQPGETLSPACAPTDTNCYVQAPITGTAASSTFQTPATFRDTLKLSATSTPSDTSAVLYNVGGVLYWNGSAVAGATGLTSLNGLSSSTQTFAIGTTGTDILIVSSTSVHTFNIPNAGASARGVVSTSTQTFAGDKTFTGTTTLATTTIARLIAANGMQFSSLVGGILQTNASGDVATTSLAALTTNAISWLGNTLTSTVNGVATTTQISYANGTTDGIVSTTTQTFAGAKTFTATTTLATTTLSDFTVTGTSTLAWVSAARLYLGNFTGILTASSGLVSTSSILSLLPYASTTADGIVSTTTQSFSGEKTFTSTTTLATTTIAHLIASNSVRFAALTGGILTTDASGNLSTTSSSVTITNALSWLGNTLTSTVNGVATTAQISYANGTTDGIVSTTTQTFAGDKTFSGTLTFATSTASTLTVTGTSTLSGVTASTLYLGSLTGILTVNSGLVGTSSILSFLPYASATADGIVSTTTESFAGEKTFTSTTTLATTTIAHLIASNSVRFAALTGGILTTDASGNLSTTSSSVTITNALSWLGNTLTSTVNGVATTTQISYANGTTDGIVSTTTQTFAGDKTFSGTLTFATSTASGLTLSQNGLILASSTPSATSTALYNLGNTLYWNGQEVLTTALACGCATGWLTGGTLSINSGDATKLDITAGSARIVDISNPLNPDIHTITWSAQTAFDPTLTGRSKWIGVQDDGSGGATFVSDVSFDSVERRSTAILGRIWTTAGTGPTITNIGSYQRPAWGIVTAFQDFVLEFGSWNIAGNAFSANGANLLLNKASGTSYRYHTESTYGQENVHTDAAQTGITTYNYHIQGSSVTYTRSALEPGVYSSGSLATSTVASNKYTRQEIYFFPVSGTIHVLYGQTLYASLAAAESAGFEGVDAVNLDILDGSIHRASIILKGNATDLTSTTDVKIINLSSGLGGAQQFAGYWSTNASGIFYNETGMNVGIGTSSPAQKLHVQRSTSGSPVRFQDSDGYCEIDPTLSLWTCTSDARLKTNVQTIESTLSGILALNPVNFDWRSQVGDGVEGVRGSRYGLIAQEVEDIFPHLVNTDAETGLKSVGYGGLTIPMLKALQEIATIASSTAGLTLAQEDGVETKTFLGQFFDRMIAWFADAANGIGTFFAESVDTKELCLTDRDGRTCYTRTQLNTALGSTEAAQTQSIPSSTNTNSSSSGSIDTQATTTGTSAIPTEDTASSTMVVATTTESNVTDTTAPILSLIGDAEINLPIGEAYVEQGATATDDVDGDIASAVSIVGEVDTSTAGTYTVTYNVADAAGNSAESLTRTVTVNTPPEEVPVP